MNNRSLLIIFVSASVLLMSSCGIAFKGKKQQVAQPLFQTTMDSVSYIIGTEIGASFKTNQIEIASNALIRGVEDAMKDSDTLLTAQQKEDVMTAFQFRLQMAEMERKEKISADNRQEQESFMKENRKNPMIMETPSGIQYRILVAGGGERPMATDTVRVHYEGRFIDGEVFDASRKHSPEPVEFPLNRVISGWTEGVQLMPVGSTYELYIPADLAYGERGNERIPPAKMLIFVVELVGITRN
jgi:FKBP-type peptidyl-prolyl cis-trans isomerase